MRNKVTAISALAAGIALAAGGTAAADTTVTRVEGGSGFSTSPVVVNAPQQGLVIVNGTVADLRCVAPWSDGAVLAGVAAPNSHYAACNTGKVDQQQKAVYKGGLLF
ncbi:hypothetical protein DMH25_37040 [Streptomyces sp. WAC 01325]|uniref:hypothetical protein n=1 Tax=Streptomyces TaxID=1883 RepID=UPI000F87145D|nr:hypothetical protein [Streptomyces sp. WAC 01325]RSM92470.1 hypothetical protein DMH25_37040 [Streptomyces sp. WAC 01325]WCH91715.1 hypothetical protein POD33_06040 [Streptomyces moderatus]